MSDPATSWRECAWRELSIEDLYAIMTLRQQVFVVEQKCIYQDLDGLDPMSRHLWAEAPSGVLAYLRIIPAGIKYPEIAIGRVVVHPSQRGTGLGRELMERGIAAAGAGPIRVAAQAHLEAFYGSLGFHRISDVYDDDGIAHVDMVRP